MKQHWPETIAKITTTLLDLATSSELSPVDGEPSVKMYAFKPGVRDERELEFVVKIKVK